MLEFVFSCDVRIIQNQILFYASINGSIIYTTETVMTCYTYSSMFYIFLFYFQEKVINSYMLSTNMYKVQ